MYVNAMAERHGANHYESAGLPDTPDGFVREIEATIVPNTRPTYVQYINGIEIYGDRVYILVNGVVLGYSLVGVLEERMTPIGTDEEQIYTHAMWISGDDMLYLIDTAHVLRVYEFMM